MNTMQMRAKRGGFTLLELLIVITILAILTLVVVLFINPVEILKKSRDVQRMSDLSTVNAAIALFLQDKTSNTLNTANCASTAASIASATSTYQYISIPGDAYYASSTTITTANYTNNDGTGWIPVNFATTTSGAPIAKLPIDPTNTYTAGNSTAYYYRYACLTNNTFEIDANLESDAYTVTDTKPSKDGGNSSFRYEVGTDLRILPTGVKP